MWIVVVILCLAAPGVAQQPVELQLVSEEPADEFGLSLLTYSDVISHRRFDRIVIRLKDDSPEDGEGGGAFFQEEISITTVDGLQFSNRRATGDSPILRFFPTLQGGFRREGFLAADGNEVITVVYDLEGSDYRASFGPAPETITSLDFVLILANDYRIDVLLGGDSPVATIGSPGNVKDGSNQVSVRFGIRLESETSVEPITWGLGKQLRH